MVPPKPPDGFHPGDTSEPGEGDELFESERNLERLLDYLDLMRGTDVQQTGAFEDDDLAVHFTVSLGDPPAHFPGFACFIKDAWVDICLLRDWSNTVRVKFRTHAEEIMNTLGLSGVSLYFMPDEDTLYMSHRVFTEGLNFDVFRASVWSLVDAQSRVAAILDQAR
jgi:hypothetical protein